MREKIVVIGLGYVGLPLAIALGRNYHVIGFDISLGRINELKSCHDRTAEITSTQLAETKVTFTSETEEIRHANIYIITVPTPVDQNNNPDLKALAAASELVGNAIERGAIIVYESTVYPGVTENFCGPILEKTSGFQLGKDIFLGYSPERINPGDKIHTVDKITKVVSGQTKKVADKLKEVYGSINNNNIFVAASIKVAEASKVIENSQRDINIAFVNEITIIFKKLGISIYDVLEAAQTKWNFLNFMPGLVGGHCIGVDPFYLADCAKKLGHNPEVILAGRRINDYMGFFIADQIHNNLPAPYGTPQKILVLGLTFKENVPDLRNSKVVDLIKRLKEYGHTVEVHDPLADVEEAKKFYNLDLLSDLQSISNKYDCIIGTVAHDIYKHLTQENLGALLYESGFIADIKNIWPSLRAAPQFKVWSL